MLLFFLGVSCPELCINVRGVKFAALLCSDPNWAVQKSKVSSNRLVAAQTEMLGRC